MKENGTILDKKVHKILIVDDENDVLEALSMTLQSAEHFKSEVFTAQNAETALAELEKQDFDLILSDYKMPNMNGIELLTKAMNKSPGPLRILITGYSDIKLAREAINKAQVHNYVEKPWDNDELILTVYEALKRKVERESDKIFSVTKVSEALQLLNEFQKDPMNFQLMEETQNDKLMFEFNSVGEFNKFSFEIKKMKNVQINDINVFENRYIITVGISPKSFDDVLMFKD